MGRLSATQSEICRDVFNDAAAGLIDDIFEESFALAEEEGKKASRYGIRLLEGVGWVSDNEKEPY